MMIHYTMREHCITKCNIVSSSIIFIVFTEKKKTRSKARTNNKLNPHMALESNLGHIGGTHVFSDFKFVCAVSLFMDSNLSPKDYFSQGIQLINS